MVKYFIILLMFASLGCNNNTKSKSKKIEGMRYQKEYAEIISKHDNTISKPPSTMLEKFMYLNGYRAGENMIKDSLVMSLDYMIQGFVDALKDESPKLHPDSMDAVINEFTKFMDARLDSIGKLQEIQNSVISVQNLKEAEEFLMKNAKEPGVVSLPSRLQYKILKEGNGKSPTSADAVLVHMTSTFSDGTVFDDTRGGNPRAIPNERMIPGWLEAITRMKEGSRWVVYMHPDLGFGESGAEGKVPPNKLTIVDVELIKVMTPEEVSEYLKQNPPKPPAPPRRN